MSWKRHGEDGAALDANPNGGGKRIYPEQTTPLASSLKNVVDLEFEVTPVLDLPVTAYYRFLDPENFIGLGNDTAAANAWTGNDNYFAAPGGELPVQIPASGVKREEFTIDPAHAGDNWIVVAAPISGLVVQATLGTTQESRYTVNPKANGKPYVRTEMPPRHTKNNAPL